MDLDGDGIELTNLDNSVAFFDIDNDGGDERSGWVAADDGLLAVDLNGNGIIDNADELFGAGETYSRSYRDNNPNGIAGPGDLDIRFDSGFDKLALFNSNADTVIDASDVGFTQLRIWRDLNQDGASQANELFTLDEAGVASISLDATSVLEENAGNLITDTASFTTTSGETRVVSDVWFRFNQYDVRFEEPDGLDPTLADLPELNGAGSVKDLRHTMAEDPGLRVLVEEFAAPGLADLARSGSIQQLAA